MPDENAEQDGSARSAAADWFFKRLNPDIHFFAQPDGTIRIASSAFKARTVPATESQPAGWISSVDSARLLDADPLRALFAEEALRDDRSPGWGIGALSYTEAIAQLAEIEHHPEDGNDAHCNIRVPRKTVGRLAGKVSIVQGPRIPVTLQGTGRVVEPQEIPTTPWPIDS